jgi:hypothetical protein
MTEAEVGTPVDRQTDSVWRACNVSVLIVVMPTSSEARHSARREGPCR